MLTDIKEMQEFVVGWADDLMPNRLPEQAFAKLLEEIEEWKDRPADGHEAADVLIIFLDVCDLVGIDVVKAFHHKMRINQKREWELNEKGLLSHVKDPRHTENKQCSTLDSSKDSDSTKSS